MLANSEDLQNSFVENNPTAVGLFGCAKRSKTTEVRLEFSESGHGLLLSFLELTSRQSHSKSPAALAERLLEARDTARSSQNDHSG
jgi:hypothetical protein